MSKISTKFIFSTKELKESFLKFIQTYGPNVEEFLTSDRARVGDIIDAGIEVSNDEKIVQISAIKKDKGVVLVDIGGRENVTITGVDYTVVEDDTIYGIVERGMVTLYAKQRGVDRKLNLFPSISEAVNNWYKVPVKSEEELVPTQEATSDEGTKK
jgi:5-keto 4-deoxyuronate isomerase